MTRFSAPDFWFQPDQNWQARALQPLCLLWKLGAGLKAKQAQSALKLPIPVICVGSPMVGGSGKTPTTLALAKFLTQQGFNPHILSRGHGRSNLKSAFQVNLKIHNAAQVGDEPLLMAMQGYAVWVGQSRAITGKYALEAGADILIMDDGMQHESLYKDIHIMVMDSHIGFGNHQTIPAGPLREPLADALQKSHFILKIGDGARDPSPYMGEAHHLLTGQVIMPNAKDQQGYDPDQRFFAFSGLAHNDKFFNALKAANYPLAGTCSFPDHYVYRDQDIADLTRAAAQSRAKLITTRKDAVKLPHEFLNAIDVIDIELKIENLIVLVAKIQKNSDHQ